MIKLTQIDKNNEFDIIQETNRKYLVEIVGDAAEGAVTNEYILIGHVILKK